MKPRYALITLEANEAQSDIRLNSILTSTSLSCIEMNINGLMQLPNVGGTLSDDILEKLSLIENYTINVYYISPNDLKGIINNSSLSDFETIIKNSDYVIVTKPTNTANGMLYAVLQSSSILDYCSDITPVFPFDDKDSALIGLVLNVSPTADLSDLKTDINRFKSVFNKTFNPKYIGLDELSDKKPDNDNNKVIKKIQDLPAYNSFTMSVSKFKIPKTETECIFNKHKKDCIQKSASHNVYIIYLVKHANVIYAVSEVDEILNAYQTSNVNEPKPLVLFFYKHYKHATVNFNCNTIVTALTTFFKGFEIKFQNPILLQDGVYTDDMTDIANTFPQVFKKYIVSRMLTDITVNSDGITIFKDIPDCEIKDNTFILYADYIVMLYKQGNIINCIFLRELV